MSKSRYVIKYLRGSKTSRIFTFTKLSHTVLSYDISTKF